MQVRGLRPECGLHYHFPVLLVMGSWHHIPQAGHAEVKRPASSTRKQELHHLIGRGVCLAFDRGMMPPATRQGPLEVLSTRDNGWRNALIRGKFLGGAVFPSERSLSSSDRVEIVSSATSIDSPLSGLGFLLWLLEGEWIPYRRLADEFRQCSDESVALSLVELGMRY